ncbi:hypothetical protein [Thermococcus sp.]|uniref:hypothetical protein n=1 Tax=Thermococcus sp. TaxID=35749 RepID=UPI00261F2FDC|nr:hypothetical protein [Thermococcus sp.]
MSDEVSFSINFGGMKYTLYTTETIFKYLEDYISLYPKKYHNENNKIHLTILPSWLISYDDLNLKIISSNPKTHYELEDGFGYHDWIGDVFFRVYDNKPHIELLLSRNVYRRDYLKKLLDKEFQHPIEYLGQILHERLLVPSVILFSRDPTVVHASSVLNPDTGEVLVFSGTGGIGKTFLEMYLILNHGFSFFADDMSIISKKGIAYPNYAFPKIYKYNVRQLSQLYCLLKSRYSILNRLHWKFHSYIPYFGKYTRRKLDPRLLPNFTKVTHAKISDIFVLFRDFSINTVKIEDLQLNSDRELCDIFFNVLVAEYRTLFSHLLYHSFNRRLLLDEVLFDIDSIRNKFCAILRDLRSKSSINLVRIPRHIDLRYVGRIIASSIK